MKTYLYILLAAFFASVFCGFAAQDLEKETCRAQIVKANAGSTNSADFFVDVTNFTDHPIQLTYNIPPFNLSVVSGTNEIRLYHKVRQRAFEQGFSLLPTAKILAPHQVMRFEIDVKGDYVAVVDNKSVSFKNTPHFQQCSILIRPSNSSFGFTNALRVNMRWNGTSFLLE